ncbi:hypothetical protein [Burkholderia glumae]|uniref:hypothetical protein n=1 Tax=Burkholderia glumae TaxID=337 RepID=UPI0012FBC657|nr:hypothetical protein [Burkholderia glumae]MCM2493703.1 hypothetical protein [Burkholderia glumae]MCM2543677.1 hypothetical protein [Burkholderia glumae]
MDFIRGCGNGSKVAQVYPNPHRKQHHFAEICNVSFDLITSRIFTKSAPIVVKHTATSAFLDFSGCLIGRLGRHESGWQAKNLSFLSVLPKSRLFSFSQNNRAEQSGGLFNLFLGILGASRAEDFERETRHADCRLQAYWRVSDVSPPPRNTKLQRPIAEAGDWA